MPRCNAMLQTHLLSLCLPEVGLRSSEVLLRLQIKLAGGNSVLHRQPLVVYRVLAALQMQVQRLDGSHAPMLSMQPGS